jgi:NAD(P)-dependent dehydrogenase (short-subunit alcohol dehydrogenase family)
MKVLVIGASGDIGRAVVREFERDSDVLAASYHNSDICVDIQSSDSIQKMYQQIGAVDAVICAAARGVVYAPLADMTVEKYQASFSGKLYGQIALVLQGIEYVKDAGSFTLTTGLLNSVPIPQGSAAATVNGAVEGFAVAAAIDLPRGLRINVVSPALLSESAKRYGDYFQGHDTVPASLVAAAYRQSVYGGKTGQIYRVGW